MQEIMNGQNWRAQRDRITTLLSKTVKGIQVHRWGRRICLGLSDFEKEDGKIIPLLPSLKQTASALLGFQTYLQKWGGKNSGRIIIQLNASGNRLKEGSNLVSGAVLGSVIPFIVIIFIAIVFIFIYEYSRTGKYSKTDPKLISISRMSAQQLLSYIWMCIYRSPSPTLISVVLIPMSFDPTPGQHSLTWSWTSHKMALDLPQSFALFL